MAGGKTNTTRIEQLEDLMRDLLSRLNVHDETLKWVSESLKKGTDTTAEHGLKIVSVEEKLFLVDFRKCIDSVTTLQQDLVAFRKDLESLQKWKEELKKEKEEATRRWWSFGPNITAAMISGFITLFGVVLTYLLNRPK
jgi:chromosome segregation ATPase